MYSDDDSDYDDDSEYGLPIARSKPKCTLCSDEPVFDNLIRLEEHMEKDHSPHICQPCKKDFGTEDDLIYHKIRSPLHIICVDCHMEYKSQGGLALHRKQVCLSTFCLESGRN